MSLATPSIERQKRVTRALSSPGYFGEVYVRPFDANWTDKLPGFGWDMLEFSVRVRRGVIVLAPEFLKTTLCSQVLPLWLTYRHTIMGELLRGMLFSEEEGMAINNLSVIAWHVENNDLLAADFCDRQGRPLVYPDPEEKTWRDDAIVVCRKGSYKDPTWQAKGLNSSGIQGRRLDWLIGDDVITPANAFSPAKREKAIRDWDMQITTRLVESGTAIVAGNFNDPHDLVSSLAARPQYEVFKRPALHRAEDPSEPADIGDEGATPLWPENWPLERLAREKEEKPNRFQRIFLLNATSEMGEKLRVDWVQRIDPEDVPLKYSRIFISVDPAPGGETEDLDFFTITVGALHDTHLDVMESFAVRAPVPDQVRFIRIMHDRWARIGMGVIAIGISKVALDRYFAGAITIHSPDLKPKLADISAPGDKHERLEALGPYAKTGWLRICEPAWTVKTSDSDDQYQELSLYEEWKEFPNGRHDDRLDGLDILCRTAREFATVRDVEVDLIVQEA